MWDHTVLCKRSQQRAEVDSTSTSEREELCKAAKWLHDTLWNCHTKYWWVSNRTSAYPVMSVERDHSFAYLRTLSLVRALPKPKQAALKYLDEVDRGRRWAATFVLSSHTNSVSGGNFRRKSRLFFITVALVWSVVEEHRLVITIGRSRD